MITLFLFLQLHTWGSNALRMSLQKGLHYLTSRNPTKWDTFVLPILAFLEKNYAVKVKVPYEAYIRQAGPETRLFITHLSQKGIDTTGLHEISPFLQSYARLFLCKGFAHEKDLDLVRQWWEDKHGYGITHAYLLAWIAKTCNCALQIPLWDTILTQAPTYFRDILYYHRVCEDITVETLVFWAISGYEPMKLHEALVLMTQYQLPDGGWAFDCETKKSHDHTTLLAIWALYAYLYPEKNTLCFIEF